MRFMINLGLIKLQKSHGENVDISITSTSESTSSFWTSESLAITSSSASESSSTASSVGFSSTTSSLESPGFSTSTSIEVDTVILSTSSIASSTSSFYPLTTVFVPPTECTSFYLYGCYGTTECSIGIWPESVCTGDGYVSCYPSYDDYQQARTVYSPGRSCPQGMTTAASAISPAGVWCCPMGLTWASSPPWCQNRIYTGTMYSEVFVCGYSPIITLFGGSGSSVSSSAYIVVDDKVTSFNGGAEWMQTSFAIQVNAVVFTAQAKGVFLEGQSITPTATTLSTKIGAQIIPSSGDDAPTNSSSRSVPIAAVVGGVLGACILVGLGYVLWRRKRSRRAAPDDDPIDTGASVNRTDPSERPHDDYRKVELDASTQATRSELEGSVEPNHGAGIYVRKPELEGTRGESHTEGSVYVENKAELEAHMRAAELEAIPWSARREEQTLPPSPTIPGPSRFNT
ncbi:hypothetical protein F4774DRAFT_408035 [Daldinia eschscholtzii]|nr:hypothetical protein F4774DRAFT_408035 [Daldinia eschscholtzii]